MVDSENAQVKACTRVQIERAGAAQMGKLLARPHRLAGVQTADIEWVGITKTHTCIFQSWVSGARMFPRRPLSTRPHRLCIPAKHQGCRSGCISCKN